MVESSGFDALGPYVELFWLPVLGPSATLLLRRLASELRASPDGYDLELDVAARALGLGGVGGRRSPLRRAILRCTRYSVARHLGDDRLAVRRWLTALPERTSSAVAGAPSGAAPSVGSRGSLRAGNARCRTPAGPLARPRTRSS